MYLTEERHHSPIGASRAVHQVLVQVVKLGWGNMCMYLGSPSQVPSRPASRRCERARKGGMVRYTCTHTHTHPPLGTHIALRAFGRHVEALGEKKKKPCEDTERCDVWHGLGI